MVKISVILPVYNEELYLKQCLDSLRAQTLSEIEIICVDDGSTDNSLMILRDYEEKDHRIKVLTQKNQYAGTARNYGMRHATGAYLLFLDSDDFVKQDMLEKMYQKAEEGRLDITVCRYDFYNDITDEKLAVNFHYKASYYPKDKDIFSGRDMKYAGIFQAVEGWAWDKLFCVDFVKRCGYEFPDFRSSEDGFFVYLLMARAERIGLVPEKLVYHRVYNPNSLSNTMEQNWENGFQMLRLIRDELWHQGLYELYEQSYISWAIGFQLYYLKAMNEKKAFDCCYQYIRTVMEPDMRLSEFSGEYLCGKGDVEQYRQILNMDAEEFLFVLLREKEERLCRMGEKGWVFPYHLIPKGCRLILYGAGSVGQAYYEQLEQTGYCSWFALVDKHYEDYQDLNKTIKNPKIIEDGTFDYILISIQNKGVQEHVKAWMQSMGIPASKIKGMNESDG